MTSLGQFEHFRKTVRVIAVTFSIVMTGTLFASPATSDDWQESNVLSVVHNEPDIYVKPTSLTYTRYEMSVPTEQGEVGIDFLTDHDIQSMRNPAAVYCSLLGCDFEIVESRNGGQHGVCRLPDETTCDAWDFLNGKCGQDHSICALEGLETVTLRDGKNPFSKEYAVCVDSEGRVLGSVTDVTGLVEKSQGGAIDNPLGELLGPSEPPPDFQPPTSFDWRDHNGSDWMTPVKSQGICGSCWAFSAVGVTEGVINIASGNPGLDLNLSEQYLVTDCALTEGACDGGYKGAALSYVRDSGVPDENCLPYHDGDPSGCTYTGLGNCDTSMCTYYTGDECSDYRCSDRCSDWASRLHTIDSSTYMGYNPSEITIKEALVDHGPLAVSMNMGGSFDQNDVYHCPSNDDTGHAVVVVGYDDSGGYWIVRNSWGDNWGPDNNGYFNVAYNNCAIQKYPYYADASPIGDVGPLLYDSHTVDDDDSDQSNGNDDCIVNCGETIELYVDLYNQGSNTATGVNATISTSDPYVTFIYNTSSSYPDIPGGDTGANTDDFDFVVDPGTPDGHVIHFDLDITASNGGPWSDLFDVPVVCGGPAQWTFLVYLDGDNDLEGAGIDDFLEMSSVGSNSDINVVVQFDRISGHSTDYGDWTTTKRFLVTPGMTPISDNALQDIGEANMGDPQTLIDFVQWGMTNYPAGHYAVILWNHGDGWRLIPDEVPLIKGIIYDDTDGDNIDMPELRSVMDTLSNGGSDPLDLVGFDACLMAMIEVDNQLIPYVDVRVGSEETEPWDGWPYDTILSSLTADPAMSASQLGTVIVDAYYASYGNGETQSAVDLHSPYSDLNSAVNDFAVALINGVGSHYTDIATARSSTQEFYYVTYIDLFDFAYQVNQYVSDATINAAATDVMNAVNSAVIHEQHGATWPGAHGISIYFPESEGAYDSTYDGSQGWLEFTANTQWDEWLHAFYSPPTPDIGVSTTSFEETVLEGEMVTKTLTINNTGGSDLEFDIWESTTMLGSGLTFDKTIFSNSTAKKPPEGLRLPSMSSSWMPLDVMLDEGFEGGVVPPTEWELIQTNAAETWEIDTYDPHSGSYNASCFYDPALNSQDEVLLSPVLDLSSGHLNFWSLGSLDWCRDDSDNCDLNIWLVVGDWGGGDDVFVGKADDDWADTWVWSESTYDLTPLLTGEPIRLGFQYEGLDGAQISIDDIVVAGDLAPDVPWLSEDPITGTVSAGGSLPVDVTFDATGLARGDYTADLVIYSNDPDENPVTVSVVMHVTDNNPPNTPSSPSPTDGAIGQDINVDLGWTGGDPDAGNTVTYGVYFEADDSTPDNLICNDVSTPACDPGTLAYNTHYYWYVVATDNHAASTTGDTWDFYTICPTPSAPSLSSPPNGSETDDTTPTFSWASVSGATSYRIQVDDDFGFSSPEINQTTSSTSYTPGSELPDGAIYYWQVQAFNSCGNGPWSVVWEFAIPAQSPWVAWIYLPAVVRGYP